MKDQHDMAMEQLAADWAAQDAEYASYTEPVQNGPTADDDVYDPSRVHGSHFVTSEPDADPTRSAPRERDDRVTRTANPQSRVQELKALATIRQAITNAEAHYSEMTSDEERAAIAEEYAGYRTQLEIIATATRYSD